MRDGRMRDRLRGDPRSTRGPRSAPRPATTGRHAIAAQKPASTTPGGSGTGCWLQFDLVWSPMHSQWPVASHEQEQCSKVSKSQVWPCAHDALKSVTFDGQLEQR